MKKFFEAVIDFIVTVATFMSISLIGLLIIVWLMGATGL